MKALADPRKARQGRSAPDDLRALRPLRWLIFLYFILLIIEGALRKWVAPQLSDPLLIIRDPVVLAIYYLALRARVFPRNGYVASLAIIAVLSFIVGLLVLMPYVRPLPLLLVNLFGVRSNFLHLPLIFVIAKVFDADDVKRIGWWTLVVMIPMALLMVAQFTASPDSFINRAAGLGEGQQITAGGGKIRPPGTFSFVTGTVYYVSAATAFLLYGALSTTAYRNWLLASGGFAIALAVVVSGSRSLVGSVVLVVLSLGAILLLRPSAVNKFGRNLFLAVLVALIMTRLPIFSEGVDILSERFTAASEAADSSIAGGLISRTLSGFTEGFARLDAVPWGGYGLGIGTNGGARFLVGRAAFLLAEGEWARVLLESGPILGIAFLLWRTVLTGRIGYLSLNALRKGEILPILLFSAGFLALLNGQLGQPTSLGFAVVLNGLCLAATRRKDPPDAPPVEFAQRPRIPRRSAYAERLHGSPPRQPNGSAAR